MNARVRTAWALFICASARLCVCASVFAQGGTTAWTLLQVPATPRSLALQGAYTSVIEDEGVLFVNPAGISTIRHLALGASAEQGLFGTRLATGALVLRLNQAFEVGFGAMYLDLSGDSIVVPDPATGGDFGMATGGLISAFDALAVGAIAYRRGVLSVGGSVKALHEDLGSPVKTTTFAGDLGFEVAVFDIFSLGYVVQNIGGHSSAGAQLPHTSRLGFTLNFIDPQGVGRLMVTTDWISPPGNDSYWAFGFEAGVVGGGVNGVGVLGRLGVSAGRPETARGGYSLGVGLVVKSLRVDYAWQPYSSFAGAQQRMGVRWVP